MDLNASSKSELLAVILVLEWKILQSFLFLQYIRLYKTNTIRTLNFFKSLNYYFNLFLIIVLVLISCNSGSKRLKISTL